MMRVRVLQPGRAPIDDTAIKLEAESVHGQFALLPRHLDVVMTLKEGLVVWNRPDGSEHAVAIDPGILVKCAEQVSIATPYALEGDLPQLGTLLRRDLTAQEERARQTRTELARLEAGLVRRFMALGTP